MRVFGIKLVLTAITFLFISVIGIAGDVRLTTGVVRDISKNRIELDLPTGMISSIGFTCKPSICELTENLKVGDEVLVGLGSENRKNTLMSLRKCVEPDDECRVAKESELQKEKEHKKLLKKIMLEQKACRDLMDKELADDKRYIPINISNNENAIDRYNKHLKDPDKKMCLLEVVRSHEKAVYESCVKHDCGKNIGGGCSHIVGYSVSKSVLSVAVEKCSE